MALPDYFKRELGTAVIWGDSGGTGVTNNMTLDALANGAGREGVSADLGAQWDDEYLVYFVVETGTAPTAGNIAKLYLASTDDTGRWPARVTGADAAWPAAGTLADVEKQLGAPASILVADNATNTTIRQNPVIWRPQGRYVAPVVVNSLGQAFRDQATASNNTSRVIIVPRRNLVQDTA